MNLTRFEVDRFRNLTSVLIEPHPAFNLVTGENGAGKSSLLEAIHCLAVGHSFRTRRPREYIARDADDMVLAARLVEPRSAAEHRCGVRRSRDGTVELRLDFAVARSQAEIARLMPVKALTPESHRLIQEGPDERRQFLDWGGFHGSEEFLPVWRRCRRALSQRNEALRGGASSDEIRSWDDALGSDGERLQALRSDYLAALMIHVERHVREMSFPFHVELALRSGWADDRTLPEALAFNLATHQKLRTTTDGPHRADIVIKVEGVLAREMLSRGQQKLLVHALHLAQLDCLEAVDGRRAIVLCDDLAAELDEANRDRLLRQMLAGGAQVFVADVDVAPYRASSPLPPGDYPALFELSRGVLRK